LSPAEFQKGWFYSLTGFGQWASCDDNVSSIGDMIEETLTNKTKFKLISYNVWGAHQDSQSPYFQFELRAKAILYILEQESPDIICLQEVSKDWALKILNNDYIRTHYFSTDAAPDRMERYFGLSQITLSKYPIVACTVY